MSGRQRVGVVTIAAVAVLAGCSGGASVPDHDGGRSGSGGAAVAGTGGSGGSLGSGGATATGGSGSGGAVVAGSGGAVVVGSGGTVVVGSGGTVVVGSGGAGSGGAGSSGGAGGVGGASGGAGGARAGSGGAAAGGAGGAAAGGAGGTVASGPIKVLIWNNALTYGHQSRITAIPYLQARQASDGLSFDVRYAHTQSLPEGQVDASSDPSVFTDAGLDAYDVVFFLNTTGNTLDQDGQGNTHRQALIDFVKKGRGFVGTHSATDTYQGTAWPWYVDFIGANFKDHSMAGTSGTARYASNVAHPVLTAAAAPNPWNRKEEWYTFTRDPTLSPVGVVTVLLVCTDTVMTAERPSAWVHEMPADPSAPRAGRMFYTAFGHDVSAFQEKAVMDLVVAGIKWAAYRL
jgi:type 1 glutamine amidotransferase